MIDYDPYSKEAYEDPLPFYQQLRDEAPCYFIEGRNAWALSRFQDVWDAHLDTAHFTARHGTMPWHAMSETPELPAMLHQVDPPLHGKLQKAVMPYFDARAIERLTPEIERLARARVDAAYERGSFDIVHDLAWPLAAEVTCLVMGLPIEEAALMKELTETSQDREPGVAGPSEKGNAALRQIISLLVERTKERRAAGFDGEGMIDMFGRLEIDGEPIGDDFAIAMQAMMFYTGGSSQFPKGFGALAYRLHENPDQRAEVVANPELAQAAFLEALRIDNPTQMLGRQVTAPVEIHGQTLERGQGVLFLYASAGRDEREFDEPDRFDIHRRPERTISFGAGPHMCTGRGIGTFEGVLLARLILERMPEYAIDTSQLEPIRTEYMRGWQTLPATRD